MCVAIMLNTNNWVLFDFIFPGSNPLSNPSKLAASRHQAQDAKDPCQLTIIS